VHNYIPNLDHSDMYIYLSPMYNKTHISLTIIKRIYSLFQETFYFTLLCSKLIAPKKNKDFYSYICYKHNLWHAFGITFPIA